MYCYVCDANWGVIVSIDKPSCVTCAEQTYHLYSTSVIESEIEVKFRSPNYTLLYSWNLTPRKKILS